ncbi:unnamed protein product [Ostreobium quekettii]|uniref:Aminopeptidase n=1 Tax=Ostreobium quekettii TaxID=121088 RepID=A0A8S1J0G9_9CHLO|nr:unnamed protein product [Ostreobium quekettii]
MEVGRAQVVAGSAPGSHSVAIDRHSLDNQRIVFRFPSPLPRPRATVVVDFSYTLRNDTTDGFWRHSYDDENGNTRWMAATQLEATSARKMLPCFDEPDLKAEFQVTLTTPSDVVALSNMPVESQETMEEGAKMKHRFFKTPKMPTYLLAIAVGELRNSTKVVQTRDGAKAISVWSTPTRATETARAVEFMASSLTYFEDLFDISYPLPKLDWVAVPGFGGGAMENWGLILSRETDILASDAYSSAMDWKRTAQVTAHEISHSWFGNLVTMRTWGDLWLNEGFAKHFEMLGAANSMGVDAGFMERFYLQVGRPALWADELPWSKVPLSRDEGDWDGDLSCGMLRRVSGPLNYWKGASILRMLHTYLIRDHVEMPQPDEDAFLVALRLYLSRFQFNNTVTADLLDTLQESTGQPFRTWMHRWLYHGGHPVVNVTLGGPDGRDVFIAQKPFDLNGAQQCDSSHWWIPVRYRFKSKSDFEWMLLEDCNPLKLGTLRDEDDTVLVNADRFGFYRVQYDPRIAASLLSSAMSTPEDDDSFRVGPIDLAAMLDDAFVLARSNALHFNEFLNLTTTLGALRNTGSPLYPDSSPWAVALPLLLRTRDLLTGAANIQHCTDLLEDYVTGNVTVPFMASLPTVQSPGDPRVGLDFVVGEDDKLDFRLMRMAVLENAGLLGDEEVTRKALQLDGGGGVDLHPDIQRVVYSLAVAGGNATVYKRMKSKYLDAEEVHEEVRALHALTYAPNEDLVADVIRFTISDAVDPQNKVRVISRMSITGVFGGLLDRGAATARAVYRFFKAELEAMVDATDACKVAAWLQDAADVMSGAEFSADLNSKAFSPLVDDQSQAAASRLVTLNQDWQHRFGESTCGWLQDRLSG